MSVSFSSESPLNLTFELVIFSVFSRVFDDAKKAFNSSAINFESEQISPSSVPSVTNNAFNLLFALYILVKGFRVMF